MNSKMVFEAARLGALALPLLMAASPSALAAPPGAKEDITGKLVYLKPGAWLRTGPSLLSKYYTSSQLSLELKGRGACTIFACPVDLNGVALFARRSQLDIDKPAGPTAPMRSLRRGDMGEDVRALQLALVKAGYPIVADGNFGRGTLGAVLDYQRKSGLKADGVVGPVTRGKLAI